MQPSYDTHRHIVSVDSICAILSCNSDEFLDFYENRRFSTETLVQEAQANIIDVNRERLRSADQKYRLDDMLSAMLENSPHQDGKRYVAVALRIAQSKGGDVVVEVAQAWLEHLFLPMLDISRFSKTEPSSSQPPTIDDTVQSMENATRSEQSDLRAKVSTRESYRCAITQAFDSVRVDALIKEGRLQEIPIAPQHRLAAAHIIPFSLNDFTSDVKITREVKDSARTCDMLQSWTRIDIEKLVGSRINSPANVILMTTEEHISFGEFVFYFDKEAVSRFRGNSLLLSLMLLSSRVPRARNLLIREGRRLTNGELRAEVEFRRLAESDIEPPDPEFLQVHAAFAKVLNFCGATEYIGNAEKNSKKTKALFWKGETDFAALLTAKLLLVAR